MVYPATATGERSLGTVHRQSRWLAGMCHCNGVWLRVLHPVGHRPVQCHGVGV